MDAKTATVEELRRYSAEIVGRARGWEYDHVFGGFTEMFPSPWHPDKDYDQIRMVEEAVYPVSRDWRLVINYVNYPGTMWYAGYEDVGRAEFTIKAYAFDTTELLTRLRLACHLHGMATTQGG